MSESEESLKGAPLGDKSAYKTNYDKSLLFPIPRSIKRAELGIEGQPIFSGYDIWNAYELSWLNSKGKPQVAIAEFYISSKSTNIIESKSFKLYLNSFNNTKFSSWEEVTEIIKNDIAQAVDGDVIVDLRTLSEFNNKPISSFKSDSLDEIDIECDEYMTNGELLKNNGEEIVELNVFSDLLKSNCLVTGQPDWGSVDIHYVGKSLCKESLLKYIVSFRNHNEFHEQCVERIFMDIYNRFKPDELTVFARYTRRGGLDINPIRSLVPISNIQTYNQRQPRQ